MRTSALLLLCTGLLPAQGPADLNRVQAGQPAPDFTLESRKGEPVKLSQFRGKKRVVLVFYRGQW